MDWIHWSERALISEPWSATLLDVSQMHLRKRAFFDASVFQIYIK